MKRVFGLVISAILIQLSQAAPATKTKSSSTTKSSTTVSKTNSSKKGSAAVSSKSHVTASQSASRTKSAKTSSHPAVPTVRASYVRTKGGRRKTVQAATAHVPSYQSHPDEDRYREIQQALANKGYFKGEVNGQWGADSADALQRFQIDQKFPDTATDGKINSLSLIGLGLGPSHGGAPPPPPAPSAAANPEKASSAAAPKPPPLTPIIVPASQLPSSNSPPQP